MKKKINGYTVEIVDNYIHISVDGYANTYQLNLADEGLILDAVSEHDTEPLKPLFAQTHEEAIVCDECGKPDCSLDCDGSQGEEVFWYYYRLNFFVDRKHSGSVFIKHEIKLGDPDDLIDIANAEGFFDNCDFDAENITDVELLDPEIDSDLIKDPNLFHKI